MDEPVFHLHFNRKRQWVAVYLWDVHPNTFERWDAGRWGYWLAEWTNCRSGHFGSLHFIRSRLRIDTISHEIDHWRQEWLWANRNAWTGRNEESCIEIKDRLLWRFLKELAKVEPKTRSWCKTLSEL